MSQRAKQDTAQAGHAGQPGLVAFVGTGPGSTELLTVRAAELLGRADLVAGRPEVIEQVRGLLPAGADIRDVADLDSEPDLLTSAARSGRLAVAVYRGDPLLFGTAAGHISACAKAKVRFEIVPGMPAATAVPAYAGIPLTSEAGGDIRIIEAAEVEPGCPPTPRRRAAWSSWAPRPARRIWPRCCSRRAGRSGPHSPSPGAGPRPIS